MSITKRPKTPPTVTTINPKHDLFALLYFSPRINGKSNPLFGNGYGSAKEAGFSDSYALKLITPQNDITWVQESYRKLVKFTPEHIVKGIEDIAGNPEEYTRDRLKAYDSLAKIQGMYIERVQQDVQVTFTNSVPRPLQEPVIDITPDSPPTTAQE